MLNFIKVAQKNEVNIVFYERFIRLCEESGIKPSKVAIDCSFNKGSVSVWKKKYDNGLDVHPTAEILNKISRYFSVSVDYLLGNTDVKRQLINDDAELNEYLDELRSRSEMRMLFSVSKGCTKDEVMRTVKIIEALRKKDDE